MLVVIIIALVLLLAFIILSSFKLSIYFNTFLYLSKKINYDKTNYISNSSFFKYFYTNKMFFGLFGIELLITLILVAMSLFAYAGYVLTNHMNFGYLDNNYGGAVEFAFINYFIYSIFALAIIYGGAYIYWYNYDKDTDGKLYKEEENLKKTLVEHLDYELLYDYYKKTIAAGKYELGKTYVINIADPAYFTDANNVFKYCFTYHILNDAKFTLLKSDILDIIKAASLWTPLETKINGGKNKELIKQAIIDKNDLYIIARYNHNNNIALRPLNAIINDLMALMTDTSNSTHKTALIATQAKIKAYNDDATIEMQRKYDETQKSFMTTIKLYKEIYDKYYMYYMYSVLLTNFVIIYAALVFAYILIKIVTYISTDFDDDYFNAYNFTTYLNNYGLYLLLLYYFISCPVILFGFN